MAKRAAALAVLVIFGDEAYQKRRALEGAIAELLPDEAERGTALSVYDGATGEDQGGPSYAGVMDDLATLPFLGERRVVVVRDADKFITQYRAGLERYFEAPSRTGILVLECRSFPKTTRLYKAAAAVGRVVECRKLSGRGLADFVVEMAGEQRKRLDREAAQRLAELIGPDQGALAGEVEKLALYVGNRNTITGADVAELVGQTREERIFAVLDAAGLGDLPRALTLWQQVLATDPAAVFKVIGGVAFVLRKWLAAHAMADGGMAIEAIAPKVMMYGRGRELGALLRRLPAQRLRQMLARVAELDSQAKVGARSIETGIERLLVALAHSAA